MQSVVKRVENDLKQIKVAGFCDYITGIERQSHNPLVVQALLVATTSSNFADDTFTVTMRFPANYPCSPPTMEIVAAINHHAAQLMEASVRALLQADWTEANTMKDVFDLMLRLLRGNELRAAA